MRGGGGVFKTPKKDYVIYEQPLIIHAARININNGWEIQRNYRFVISSDSNVRFDLVNERL